MPNHPATLERAQRYFEQVGQAFEQASRRQAVTTLDLEIASHPLRLELAGEHLLPLVWPALKHLETPAAPGREAPFTIHCWEMGQTGVEAPAPPPEDSGVGAILEHGKIRGYCDDDITAFYDLSCDILSVVNLRERRAYYAVRDLKRVQPWEKPAPLKAILNRWLSSLGIQLIHGGAVGQEGGGVILAGPGGAGKSTSALACLASALGIISDDYCLVQPGETTWVHNIYGTAKLRRDNLERIPHLAGKLEDTDLREGSKPILFLRDHFPEKLRVRFPLRAILLPKVTGLRDTRLVPVHRMLGWKAICPSTMTQLPGFEPASMKLVSDAVRAVPVFSLEAGTDLPQIPQVIEDYLHQEIPA